MRSTAAHRRRPDQGACRTAASRSGGAG